MPDGKRFELAPGYSIPPLINGCWQLTPDHGGGPPDEAGIMRRFAELLDHGFNCFDCADIYTGVEELLGRFRRSLANPGAMQVHTKLVPDKASLGSLTAADVDAILHRSLRRLGVEQLDLVQFHWWDYQVPGMLMVAEQLMRAQQAGKVRLVGATNFDTAHIRQLLDHGVPVVSLQTQYSLLDRRPQRQMTGLAQQRGVALLPYGVLAGGLLAAHNLGAAAPAAANRSHTKYQLVIEEAGGWSAFQQLLAVLASVAAAHGVGPEQVAAHWVLQQPAVAAIILGTGTRSHVAENMALTSLELGDDDYAQIDTALARLQVPAGDMYELERDQQGPHAGIIKTELNSASA
jgi:aryl-alcohol dehydrogenase-like predicted oxidoreductase